MSKSECASRFTISIVDVSDGNSLNNSPITGQSLGGLLAVFKSAIQLNYGSDWALRLLLPFASEFNSNLLDSLAASAIEVDLIGFEADLIEKVSLPLGKQVIYPNHLGSGLLNKQTMRLSVHGLAQHFSDLMVFVGPSTETSSADLDSLNKSLATGKLILVIDTSGLIWLFSPEAISANDRAMLERFPKSWEELSRFAQVLETHEAVNQSLQICIGKTERSLDSFDVSGSTVAKWVGRLDGFLMSLYGGLGWSEIKKSLLKNPFKDYFGVSAHDLPSQHKDRHPIKEPDRLGKIFSTFDIAANYYSGCYRDTNWLLYSLSAFAVFTAVAGGISLGGENRSWLWALAECASIFGIVSLVWLARVKRFHQNWLTNRFCAEVIRYARVGLPFLLVPYGLKQIINFSSNRDDAIPELARVHRLLIDTGLPHPAKGKVYAPLNHFDELVQYATHILGDQMAFHKKTAHRNHHLAHRMHQISYYCFFLTVLAIAGHFVVHTDMWLIFTAALPALAGAIHGLVTQNEYERVAQISAMAYEKLLATQLIIQDSRTWDGLDPGGLS